MMSLLNIIGKTIIFGLLSCTYSMELSAANKK